MVDGKDQHRGGIDKVEMKPTGNPWMTSPVMDFTAGTYDSGYSLAVYNPSHLLSYGGAPDKSVTHTRSVFFLKPYYFLVVDQMRGAGSHLYESLFQLDAPAAEIAPATKTVYSREANDPQLALIPLDREGLSARIVQGQQNPLRGWIPEGHRAIPMVRYGVDPSRRVSSRRRSICNSL
jgi:hypothetical protein